MAGAVTGTAHLCTRCPCLLMSSLPRSLRFATRRRPELSMASSSFFSRVSNGRHIGVLARTSFGGIVRRELSVMAKVMDTNAAMEVEVKQPVTSSIPEFQKRLRIADIKGGDDGGLGRVGETMLVRGWVRTCRMQKTFTFIEVGKISQSSVMPCRVFELRNFLVVARLEAYQATINKKPFQKSMSSCGEMC